MKMRNLFNYSIIFLMALATITGCAKPQSPSAMIESTVNPTAEIIPTSTAETIMKLSLVLQTANGVETLDPSNPQTSKTLEGLQPGQVGPFYASSAGGYFAIIEPNIPALLVFGSAAGDPLKSIQLLANADLDEDRRSALIPALISLKPPAVVWSPDGGRLAFLAAIDHPYLELYIFDTASLSITRLSESSADIYQPVWTPEGTWIVFDETEGLNSIGLWAVTAVKAVRANGAETKTLYEPQSYAEPILGWSSPSTFIVHSAQERGPIDLREVLLESGQSKPIYNGVFDHPVFIQGNNLAVFQVSGEFTDPAVQQAGIFAASTDSPPRLLAEGAWTELAVDRGTGMLSAFDQEKTVLIDPATGKTNDFADESSLPFISLDGKTAAFLGGEGTSRPGLRLYDMVGGKPVDVAGDAGVDSAFWLPDNRLVFTSGGNLFILSSPGAQAEKLAVGVTLLGWLGAATAK